MSHLIQEYAKNLGVKISKPEIQQHYFPCLDQKYIVFYDGEKSSSKIYKHYSTVFQLVKPALLKSGIKIYQIGGDKPIAGVDRHLDCKFKNQAYVISKSLMYIGPDSHLAQYASTQGVKTLTLHGNDYANNTKPFWGSAKNKVCLEPDWNSRPCFSNEDPDRQIDSILPELVCKKLLDLCGVGSNCFDFKTINIGDSFYQKIVEVVPTSIVKGLPKQIFLRVDYGVEEEPLLYFCRNHEIIMITDQLPQLKMLMTCQGNIKKIIYTIQDKEDTIPQVYIDTLKKWGIDFILLVEGDSDLPSIRNKYFDTQVHVKDELNNKIDCNPNTKFLTNKNIVEGEKIYKSYAHFKKGLDSDDKVIDTPEYWEELKHFYIYDQEKSSKESGEESSEESG
jgi:hypothetical protein